MTDAEMTRDALRYRALRDAFSQTNSEPDDPSVGLKGWTDITVNLPARADTFPTLDSVADALLGLDAYVRSGPCGTCGGSELVPHQYPTMRDPGVVKRGVKPCPDCTSKEDISNACPECNPLPTPEART